MVKMFQGSIYLLSVQQGEQFSVLFPKENRSFFLYYSQFCLVEICNQICRLKSASLENIQLSKLSEKQQHISSSVSNLFCIISSHDSVTGGTSCPTSGSFCSSEELPGHVSHFLMVRNSPRVYKPIHSSAIISHCQAVKFYSPTLIAQRFSKLSNFKSSMRF